MNGPLFMQVLNMRCSVNLISSTLHCTALIKQTDVKLEES